MTKVGDSERGYVMTKVGDSEIEDRLLELNMTYLQVQTWLDAGHALLSMAPPRYLISMGQRERVLQLIKQIKAGNCV